MSSTQKPVAIVTGASSGIGLGITLALLERGYGVVGTSRTISKSKNLSENAQASLRTIRWIMAILIQASLVRGLIS